MSVHVCMCECWVRGTEMKWHAYAQTHIHNTKHTHTIECTQPPRTFNLQSSTTLGSLSIVLLPASQPCKSALWGLLSPGLQRTAPGRTTTTRKKKKKKKKKPQGEQKQHKKKKKKKKSRHSPDRPHTCNPPAGSPPRPSTTLK